MSVEVHVPGLLRDYCGERSGIVLPTGTVGEALQELSRRHRALYQSVCDETGAVRRHVNLFVNSDRVPAHRTEGMSWQLRAGDVLTIWPSVSGG